MKYYGSCFQLLVTLLSVDLTTVNDGTLPPAGPEVGAPPDKALSVEPARAPPP
jgi:hypothetical protein